MTDYYKKYLKYKKKYIELKYGGDKTNIIIYDDFCKIKENQKLPECTNYYARDHLMSCLKENKRDKTKCNADLKNCKADWEKHNNKDKGRIYTCTK
jgi:hypothetical protein